MANIAVTTRCNLRCPYCFANEFVNQSREDADISLDAFRKILDFILLDGSEKRVGLIGGEPTIHPAFAQILRILTDDARVEQVTVYTNGIELGRYADCFNDKFSFLINCNSPADTGSTVYEKTKNSIAQMAAAGLADRLSLGVNYYRKGFDVSYLFNLLKFLPSPRLRVSIAIPGPAEKREQPMLYFQEIKEELLRFFSTLRNRNIIPYFDCNFFPPCLLRMDDLSRFDQWGAESPLSRMKNHIAACQPVIDIMGDFTAVRCFGLSAYTREKITDFASIRDLRNYYLRTVDAFAVNTYYDEKCASCYKFKTAKCSAGCLIYKIDRILALREKVNHVV